MEKIDRIGGRGEETKSQEERKREQFLREGLIEMRLLTFLWIRITDV